MKTLLGIFFLVAITVSAQDNNTVSRGTLARGHVMVPNRITFSNDSSFTEVQVGNEIYRNKIGVYQTMVIAVLIQQWTSYQKECYADSSLIGFKFIIEETKNTQLSQNSYIVYREEYSNGLHCYPKDFYKVSGNHYKRYEKIYEHKQTTFEGFMEYLKTKLARDKK